MRPLQKKYPQSKRFKSNAQTQCRGFFPPTLADDDDEDELSIEEMMWL
jgi:hypothetical protein